MQASRPLRIGTRGSPLALAQARDVQRRLGAAHGLGEDAIEIRVIQTSGDRIQNRPLSEVGGKGLFTKEIEEALLSGDIDLAVHSMKDVATVLPAGLEIAAVLEREDVRDAFISLTAPSLSALPPAAVVGTSSLRRHAQVKRLRPDVTVINFRGNVETRLRKLAEGQAQATFLAVAGLNRLGLADRITEAIACDVMLPAVAQGAVGIEIRSADDAVRTLVEALAHEPTTLAVAAERAFLATLEGSCRTPIAALARLDGGALAIKGELLSPDGKQHLSATATGAATVEAAVRTGTAAAEDILRRAGPDLLRGTA